jgi:hypothetical protein
MFKLDGEFLEEVGLAEMPEEQKAEFLEHLQGELEERIGERVSEGLSEEQISEFERIIDGDEATIQRAVEGVEDYHADEVYKTLVRQSGYSEGSPELLGEYASVKWLAKNRPDYQEIVRGMVEELKGEIRGDKEKILGNR